MTDGLRFVIRTPHEVALDEEVQSIRVPTQTGQVGLRPRNEPLLLAVEAGLVVRRVGGVVRLAATAGGLLEADRERVVLYTPFAAAKGDDEELLAALDRVLETPGGELDARRRLGELEQRIVQEIRQGRPGRARGRSRG